MVQGEVGQDQEKEVHSYTALAGGLSTLIVLIATGMVGVVLGWAWLCYMKRGKSPIEKTYPSEEQR